MSDDAAALEFLLGQYESSTNADVGKLARVMQPVVDYVNKERVEKQQEAFDADVKDITAFFSEADGLKEIPDKLKRGFIEVHAQENAEFQTAFDNKDKNPKAWQAAKEKARDALTEITSKLPGSKGRTEVGDPSPEQLMKMTAWEWREYLDEKHDR